MKKEDIKIFTQIPTIKTERLTLRRILPTDIHDVYEYGSDPSVSKYLLWYPHTDKNYTKFYLNFLSVRYRKGEFYDWGVEIDGKLIGTCGFTSFDIDNNSAEIGYVLNSRYWGKGIGFEAASAVLKFGFEKLSLNRIEVHYLVGNTASEALSKKLGMKFEGIRRKAVFCKGEYRDVCVAAILKSEYNN